MRLKEFQVTRFRNVVDSTPIDVDSEITCLVGKNESGKSSLLQALYRLKPAYGENFDVGEHYPRWLKSQDQKRQRIADALPIRVVFKLDEQDLEAIEQHFGPGVVTSNTCEFIKAYDNLLRVSVEINEAQVVTNLLKRLTLMDATQLRLSPENLESFGELKALISAIRSTPPNSDSSDEAIHLHDDMGIIEAEIDGLLRSLSPQEAIGEILKARLPTFFLFSQYHTLPGVVDLRQLDPESTEKPASSGLQTARALLLLAETDLNLLGNDNYDIRKNELEAVSNGLTAEVAEYWTQNNQLMVQIDVDKQTVQAANGATAVARFLQIRLSDPRHGYSNNFDQRSSGFQWFFSFLAAFSEFEAAKNGVIVLLDEPALGLHAKAQEDFLRFMHERLAPSVQVIYTTHSPFMVEMGHLERVRIVEDKGKLLGAIASKDVLASSRDSLFPLQAALGYDIAQSLFVGPHNLLVEGTSDYTYLTILSDLLHSLGRQRLDERWRLLPAGGGTNIPAFVALIGPHLDVTVVADSGTQGMQRLDDMTKRGLLAGQRLITIAPLVGTPHADIEDLFEVEDYLDLFNASMNTTFTLKNLLPGDRIVKRLGQLISTEFEHGVPADYLLRHRDICCPTFRPETLDRFERLIERINDTLVE